MPSKYGGIPVASGSKFGGVPVEQDERSNLQQAGDYATGLTNQVGQGLTIGLSDEASAGMVALIASLKDDPKFAVTYPGFTAQAAKFLETYRDTHGLINQDLSQFSDENPKASIAANIAGGVLTGGAGLARVGTTLAPKGSGILRTLAADSGVAAAEGGIAGAGFADPGNRLYGAGFGAATGGVGGAVAGPTMRFFSNRSALKQQAQKALESGESDNVIAKYMLDGRGKIKTDQNAISAISNGFDEGVIASVKGSSRTDRGKMVKMLNILEKGRRDAGYSALNRPSDVVGDSVGERFRRVYRVNRVAGKKLDRIAKSLKGKDVDYSPAVNKFLNDLEGMGVAFDDATATVSFKGADIEGAEGAEALISKLVKRMRGIEKPDAYEIHRLKRFIDEQVSYGKSAQGLSGKAETIVKRLRHNLDAMLDDKFANYKMVNDAYSDTITAIDDLQTVAGTRMDLTGPNANKAIGTLSRRLLSKAQSRVPLLDALNDLQRVATKYGGKYDDDLITQVIFVDELDGLFGSSARTSFQGDIEKAIKTGARSMTREGMIDRVAEGAQRASTAVRGKSPDDLALESIRRLLEQSL